jgi:CRISPR-associated protein Csm1
MDDRKLLDATCRVAFAGYAHDLGKLAERARLPVDDSKREIHEQMYCPRREQNGRVWYTHKHAAHTVLAWDMIERGFPELVGDDVEPFAAWGDTDVDDSIVNAAGRHHRPETLLQWIVATADRVASGFEREEFERYNAAEEGTRTGRNHYTARQLSLFEHIRLDSEAPNTREQWQHRYPLRPLSPEAIFPVEAQGYEGNDEAAAQAEYRKLWEGLAGALKSIPTSHRTSWPLWLDHFDSAWACYAQSIPSATAFNVRPEVSLYDHSRTVAALTAALWRWHHEQGETGEEARRRLADPSRPDWSEHKLLLIQGDLFGIQDFIFATGGETQSRAAKLLRGRSFYVSLLTECAALRILDALALPATSQVINAAGKFLIVAPNTDRTRQRLAQAQRDFDRWFLDRSFGQSGIGLGSLPAACNDFLTPAESAQSPFRGLMRRLFDDMQTAKSRRFDLCGAEPPSPVFADYLDRFDPTLGVCAIDGRSPATDPLSDSLGRHACLLSLDQIEIGGLLTRKSRVLISTESLGGDGALQVPVFGYSVKLTGGEEESGRFGPAARDGILRRAWDFGLPEEGTQPVFAGYARRYINAYVPRFGEPNPWELSRYDGLPDAERSERRVDSVKTLSEIACDDLSVEGERLEGTEALVTLKGDVDDLGRIFERGLDRPTFAKMAGLSRQLNAFFALWLPWICRSKYPSTYTVFAGGDDFYLIGPWRSTTRLAGEMREAFARYVAGNPQIHFSAGLSITKPGLPIRQMGHLAEQELESAKARRDKGGNLVKDAVTCFGYTVDWESFGRLLAVAEELETLRGELDLSTGYLHGLLHLADMAEDLSGPKPRLASALWPSRFAYQTWRMLESNRRLDLDARKRWQARLAALLADGIRQYGSAFKIALFLHLYQHRR